MSCINYLLGAKLKFHANFCYELLILSLDIYPHFEIQSLLSTRFLEWLTVERSEFITFL